MRQKSQVYDFGYSEPKLVFDFATKGAGKITTLTQRLEEIQCNKLVSKWL